MATDSIARLLALSNSGGGSGSTDYTDLTNKPKVNSVELVGNKNAADLGLVPTDALDNYYTIEDTDELLEDKQDTITAGSGFNLNNNVLNYNPDVISTVDYVDGSVTAVEEYLSEKIEEKQDTLTAGSNITIDDNNVISAIDTTYSGSLSIRLNNNQISAVYGGGINETRTAVLCGNYSPEEPIAPTIVGDPNILWNNVPNPPIPYVNLETFEIGNTFTALTIVFVDDNGNEIMVTNSGADNLVPSNFIDNPSQTMIQYASPQAEQFINKINMFSFIYKKTDGEYNGDCQFIVAGNKSWIDGNNIVALKSISIAKVKYVGNPIPIDAPFIPVDNETIITRNNTIQTAQPLAIYEYDSTTETLDIWVD